VHINSLLTNDQLKQNNNELAKSPFHSQLHDQIVGTALQKYPVIFFKFLYKYIHYQKAEQKM